MLADHACLTLIGADEINETSIEKGGMKFVLGEKERNSYLGHASSTTKPTWGDRDPIGGRRATNHLRQEATCM